MGNRALFYTLSFLLLSFTIFETYAHESDCDNPFAYNENIRINPFNCHYIKDTRTMGQYEYNDSVLNSAFIKINPHHNVFLCCDSTQYNILNRCVPKTYYYGDNNLTLLTSLCLRSFLTTLTSEFINKHPVVVLPKEQSIYQIAVGEDTDIKKLEEDCKLWVNEYPFKYYSPDYMAIKDSLLSDGKIVISYDIIQRQLELDIKLDIEILSDNRVNRFGFNIDYKFVFGLLKCLCDKENYKSAIDDFVNEISISYPMFLINENGDIFSDDSDDIGWKLSSIVYYYP